MARTLLQRIPVSTATASMVMWSVRYKNAWGHWRARLTIVRHCPRLLASAALSSTSAVSIFIHSKKESITTAFYRGIISQEI
jgi:hypothetical protein